MARALDGIRVLELAEGTAGPMAAWFLAELGAEVCKVEPPAGDRGRLRPSFHVLNRGKRSLVLNPHLPADHDRLAALLAGADAVILDATSRRAWQLDPDALVDARAGLVVVYAPLYGSAGPYAALPEDDDLIGALSGFYTTQLSYREGPVYLVIPSVSVAQAVLTAQTVLASLIQAQSGLAPVAAEVSGIRAGHAFQAGAYISTRDSSVGATKTRRLSPRAILASYGYFAAQDGRWLFIGVLSPSQWIRLAACLDLDDFLTDPAFADGPMGVSAQEDLDRLEARIAEIFRTHPREHWLRVLADGDVPHGQIASRAEFVAEAQIEHLGMWVAVDDPQLGPTKQMGAVLRFQGLDHQVRHGAPPLDASATAPDWGARPRAPGAPATTLPLDGTFVIDLGTFIAGAYASTLLADLGAEVIKVEPLDGDPWRQWGLGFYGWSRGKHSLTLDLRDDRARDAFLRLVARADAVIDNYRPGVAERLGITDHVLRGANPEIVNVSVTANGPDGPLADRPAFDQVFQARSGLSQQQGGGPTHEPVIHQVAITDHVTASVAALGALAGLLARARGGPGRRARTSLLQNATTIAAGDFIDYDARPPLRHLPPEPHGPAALRRAYHCADGWLFLAASQPAHWASLARLLNLPADLPGPAPLDAPPDGELATILATAFAPRPRDGTLAALRDAAVPAVPCPESAELFTGETVLANRAMAVIDTGRFGQIAQCARFARFGALDPDPEPAAELGQHSRDALARAGLSPPEIDALFAAGVTSEPQPAAP